MSSFLPLQELSFLIQETLSPFGSAALLNSEGQILGMKYETLPDIGTFQPFVETVRKYFKIQEGDAALSNDPYSGGTILSVMTLVTPIQIGEQTLFLAVRTRFKPRLAHAKKLEDEGLRIPPTPIASQRKINEAILKAIASHPQAPAGLSNRLEETFQKLWRSVDLFKSWILKNPNLLTKNSQKNFLQETKSRIQKKLAELPHGEHRLDLNFETGELIRLHTELKSDEVHFDFTGTSNSKRLFLTNMVTYGTCMGAVLSFLGEDFLLNEGIFSLINVSTPEDCFLNAKYPSPAFEGVAEASSLLASAVVQSLSAISSSRSMGLNGAIPTVLSFEFDSGKIYFDAVAGGAGATAEANGLDGFFFWSLHKLQPSIEEIERLYPLIVLQSGVRQGSGGKGKMTGGNGVLRETEILENCTLKWLLGHQNTQIKGLKGAVSGQVSEILIHKKNGDKINLSESHGEMPLEKGDRVVAASAGGGGFGKINV
ncbi:MAG: hydantoinase B/oxoprolinase family protein [Pseudobdellovibrionaceae bacterium]